MSEHSYSSEGQRPDIDSTEILKKWLVGIGLAILFVHFGLSAILTRHAEIPLEASGFSYSELEVEGWAAIFIGLHFVASAIYFHCTYFWRSSRLVAAARADAIAYLAGVVALIAFITAIVKAGIDLLA